MALSKLEISKKKQGVNTTEIYASAVLDASNTEEIINLGIVASKISLQPSGDLAGNYTVSLDGVNFITGAALPGSNGIASYNTHNITVIKITRTSGSGKVVVAAVS